MPLFKVSVLFETVLRAENVRDAECGGERVAKQEDDAAAEVSATPITRVEDLPAGWDVSCRPWGERDPFDRTIGEILKEAGGAAPAVSGQEAGTRAAPPRGQVSVDRNLLLHAADILSEDARGLFDAYSIEGKWDPNTKDPDDVNAWRVYEDMTSTVRRLRAAAGQPEPAPGTAGRGTQI